MAEKFKYVAVVVIETSEKVTKKGVKEMILDMLEIAQIQTQDIPVYVDAVRVRSVKQEDTR